MINNDLIQSQLYQNITLECAVSSRPLARIIWEKKGNLMAENQMSTTQINQTMIINRLNVQVERFHMLFIVISKESFF